MGVLGALLADGFLDPFCSSHHEPFESGFPSLGGWCPSSPSRPYDVSHSSPGKNDIWHLPRRSPTSAVRLNDVAARSGTVGGVSEGRAASFLEVDVSVKVKCGKNSAAQAEAVKHGRGGRSACASAFLSRTPPRKSIFLQPRDYKISAEVLQKDGVHHDNSRQQHLETALITTPSAHHPPKTSFLSRSRNLAAVAAYYGFGVLWHVITPASAWTDHYFENPKKGPGFLDKIINGIYYTSQTMTTIGYGDIYPKGAAYQFVNIPFVFAVCGPDKHVICTAWERNSWFLWVGGGAWRCSERARIRHSGVGAPGLTIAVRGMVSLTRRERNSWAGCLGEGVGFVNELGGDGGGGNAFRSHGRLPTFIQTTYAGMGVVANIVLDEVHMGTVFGGFYLNCSHITECRCVIFSVQQCALAGTSEWFLRNRTNVLSS